MVAEVVVTSWPILVFALFLGALVSPSSAAIHDVSAPPLPGDSYGVAEFRIYIPEGVTTVRGIYAHLDPYLVDSRGIVEDPALRALCEESSFALLGARLDSRHMDTGIGNAVLRALTDLAAASGRPELAWSPLFFDGWSWGGQFGYHFTVWRPDRVLGFITQKGGLHDTGPAGGAILVPGYLIVGEDDEPYRIANLTGIFLAHRPLGARWSLAVQPGAQHERVTDRVLLDGFFHAVVTRRLPAEIPPDGPVVLQVIPEPAGWLGERATSWIGTHACFAAPADSACWFPARDVAFGWQDFVGGGAVADTFACGATDVADVPPPPGLGPNRPNPFNPATTIDVVLPVAGNVELGVFDVAGRRLTTLADETLPAGRHSFRWDGTDARGRRLPSGLYICRLRCGGTTASRAMTLVE
jgi:hypothetical protein